MPTQGKRPLGYGWEQYPFTPQSLREQLARTGKVKVRVNIERFVARHHSSSLYEVQPTGIGLLCGQNSKEFLVSVDCDGSSAYNQIRAIASGASREPIAPESLPPTVAFTSGRLCRAQYLFKIPDLPQHQRLKSRKIPTAPEEALELRGSKLQSVLPPSVHPITGYYRWLPGCRPDQIEVATAPLWVIEQMSVFEKSQRRQHAAHHYYSSHPTPTSTQADVEKVLLLLEVIHPRFADDYDSWIKVGMALKSVNPNLLRVWDEWSQLSSKYKPGECEYKWHSFKKWGITIHTLHKLANFS
ncbi:PriCT-2 domain-containing protein [Aetokthonos hydrillicola Thurmond2011]|uniref:PriCT-2 domain-containing protein n=1 Tax=Aetokthonos hydrillicola Thurmond2011 TaxID=2712845 RepID=A0AAP5ID55_9CYAN|nr:PriCT-2 domain-containing protein [Aetokthonos hydrillicola]MBO3458443.1 DNA primase [Aetokthonos hydrillicola CCALA 1050]MBW4586230.1 PriCT-2 domain-containing protein [Aetokthonos hydrillicola CCALA 1050]MDR9897837.1 PriCT-2 domain-containing protein [Aetokthonos hydrillicola Thurmond2011]